MILHAFMVSKHQSFGLNFFHKSSLKSRNLIAENNPHNWPRSLENQATNQHTQHITYLGFTRIYYFSKGYFPVIFALGIQCLRPAKTNYFSIPTQF